MKKFCSKCNTEKDISEFHFRYKENRYRSNCKQCTNKINTERYHNNPSTKKAHKEAAYRFTLKKYGLSSQEYEAHLKKQNYKCKICETVPEKINRLYVDHCHTSKKVRGLLCHHCNTGLGHFRDNTLLLSKAIEYLEANNG